MQTESITIPGLRTQWVLVGLFHTAMICNGAMGLVQLSATQDLFLLYNILMPVYLASLGATWLWRGHTPSWLFHSEWMVHGGPGVHCCCTPTVADLDSWFPRHRMVFGPFNWSDIGHYGRLSPDGHPVLRLGRLAGAVRDLILLLVICIFAKQVSLVFRSATHAVSMVADSVRKSAGFVRQVSDLFGSRQ